MPGVELALAAFVFAPALALGSFLNVVAARLPERRSLVHPRSACSRCGGEIAWYDNVPLVSYVALRGRCRSCSAADQLALPGGRAGDRASSWPRASSRFGLTGDAVVAAYFCAALVVLSAIDAERRILPDLIVLPSFVHRPRLATSRSTPTARSSGSLAALGASLFLFLALLAYPKGMGMGDVKLALLLGAMLGKSVSVGMMIGMLAALVSSSCSSRATASGARKMAIPFGPFLAFGAIVALFSGERVLDAYLGLF